MKKSLLTKVFTCFLVGSMLTVGGCKDYDDDIDDLNNKIDQLTTGNVAPLTKQVAALESSLKSIQAMDQQLDAAIKALQETLKKAEGDNATLKSQIKSLEDAKTDLQNQINTINETLKTVATKDYVDQSIANLNTVYAQINTVTTLQNKVDKVAGDLAALEIPAMKDITAAINAAAIQALTDAKAAMGPAITNALTEYTKSAELTAQINAVITAAKLATSADVVAAKEAADKAQSELTAFKNNFTASVNSLITTAITQNNSVIDTKIATEIQTATTPLTTAIADLTPRVTTLEGQVALLTGRIQSLVYVPTTADGVAHFGGSTAGKINLTTSQKLELTFRVSPASLAESLVASYAEKTIDFSFVTEVVSRAAADVMSIESVKATKDGKIIILANTTYKYNTAQTLAIALRVNSKEKNIECTSPYLTTDGQTADVTKNFYLAKLVDGQYVAYANKATYELTYNDMATTIELMKDYELMYKSGNDFLKLDVAKATYHWDVLPVLAIKHTAAAYSGSKQTQLTVTPKDPVVSANQLVSIKNNQPSEDQIGAKYTLTTNTFISDGKNNVALTSLPTNTFVSELTLIRKALNDITVPVQKINWTYTNYSRHTPYFTKDITLVNSGLTTQQLEAMRTTINSGWKVEATDKDGNIVPSIDVTCSIISADAQVIQFAVRGYSLGDLCIKMTNEVNINSNEVIKFSGEIDIEGLPETIAAFDVSKTLVYNNATTNLEINADFGKEFYKRIDKKFFKNEAEFLSVLGTNGVLSSTEVTTTNNGAKARLAMSANKTTVNVNFTNVNFTKQPSIVYNVDKTDALTLLGMKIPFTGTITFNESANKLVAGTNLTGTAGNYYSNATGKINKDEFIVNNIRLDQSYTAAAAAGTTVTYTIQAKPSGYTGNMPILASDGITMSWNGCTLTSVNVVATLENSGVILDSKPFAVKLAAPVNYSTFTSTEGNVYVEAGKEADPQGLNLYTLMSMKDFRGTEMFTKTGLETFASATTGYASTVTFSNVKYSMANGNKDFSRFSLSSAGIFTVVKSDSELAGTVTAEVTVTMTDRFTLDGKFQPVQIEKKVIVKFYVGAKPVVKP